MSSQAKTPKAVSSNDLSSSRPKNQSGKPKRPKSSKSTKIPNKGSQVVKPCLPQTKKMRRALESFDFENPPERVKWVVTKNEQWDAYIDDKKVPQYVVKKWREVFNARTMANQNYFSVGP